MRLSVILIGLLLIVGVVVAIDISKERITKITCSGDVCISNIGAKDDVITISIPRFKEKRAEYWLNNQFVKTEVSYIEKTDSEIITEMNNELNKIKNQVVEQKITTPTLTDREIIVK